jgi:hypothetical protein
VNLEQSKVKETSLRSVEQKEGKTGVIICFMLRGQGEGG